MALTINGFGTRFYGKKWQPDGTYITTKYVIFFWIPVTKLSEHRVSPLIPRELRPGASPSRALSALLDIAYVLAAMAALFIGLPLLLRWLHSS